MYIHMYPMTSTSRKKIITISINFGSFVTFIFLFLLYIDHFFSKFGTLHSELRHLQKKAFISLFIFPARSSPFRKSNYEFAFKPVPPGPYVQGLFNACETVHLISSSGHFCYVPIRKLPPKVHVSWRQCLDHTRARFCFHSFTRWRSYVIWLLRHYLFSQKWDTIRRIIVTKLRRLIDEIQ
jgi:hypothetical protein